LPELDDDFLSCVEKLQNSILQQQHQFPYHQQNQFLQYRPKSILLEESPNFKCEEPLSQCQKPIEESIHFEFEPLQLQNTEKSIQEEIKTMQSQHQDGFQLRPFEL